MADKLKVPADAGPYEATLSLGRFPFDWELWDYARAGAGWSKVRLGGGSGFCRLRLPHGARADLAGHALVWSLTLVNFDPEARATEVTAALVGPKGETSAFKVTFDATPDRPHVLVTAQVEA